MRKKLMIPALLLGVLFLGSCVKETESQSVTDIRDAKAEQLLARADLNNAAAQATKIAAEADVALMEAKARAEAANTALYKAQTETIKKQQELTTLKLEAAKIENEAQKIENQKAQLEVEKALFDLDLAKKQAQLDLAQIAEDLKVWQKKYEAALAKAQLAVAQAKQDILDYEKQLVDNANQAELNAVSDRLFALSTASTNYEQALKDLNKAQANLLKAEANLVKLETELVDLKTLQDETVIDNNNEIAEYKAYIEILKKYTNYREDIDDLKAQYRALELQEPALYNDYVEKYNAEIEAYAVVDEDLAKLYDELVNDTFYLYMTEGTLAAADPETNALARTMSDVEAAEMEFEGNRYGNPNNYFTGLQQHLMKNVLNVDITIEEMYDYMSGDFVQREIVTCLGFFKERKKEQVAIEEGDNYLEFSISDSLYIVTEGYKQKEDPRKVELRLVPVMEHAKSFVENYIEFADFLKACYDGEAPGYFTCEETEYYDILHEYRFSLYLDPESYEEYYTEYAKSEKKKLNAVERTKAAKEDYDDDPTEENLRAYLNAYKAEAKLKMEVEDIEYTIAGFQRRVDACEIFYDYYLNEADYLAAFQEKLDAYNEAVVASDKAKVDAITARIKSVWAYNAALDEMYVIANIVSGTASVAGAQWIADRIAETEKAIAVLEEENVDMMEIEKKEQAIELQKLRVERRKVLVDAAQANADALKAELDALLKE